MSDTNMGVVLIVSMFEVKNITLIVQNLNSIEHSAVLVIFFAAHYYELFVSCTELRGQ